MTVQIKKRHLEAEQLIRNIAAFNKRLDANFSKAIEQHGLKKSSFDVLYALLEEPEHELTPSQLIEATGITSGTMTTRVDKLIGMDLVKRIKGNKDKRNRKVRLTQAGLDLIKDTVKDHYNQLSKLVSPLSKTDCETINHLINKWMTENS